MLYTDVRLTGDLGVGARVFVQFARVSRSHLLHFLSWHREEVIDKGREVCVVRR